MVILPFDVQSELDLYLVLSGLKPAAKVGLDARIFKNKSFVRRSVVFGKVQVTHYSFHRFVVIGVKRFLLDHNIPFQLKAMQYYWKFPIGSKIIKRREIYHSYEIIMGRSRVELDVLLLAKDLISEGMAFGYPETDVRSFRKKKYDLVQCGNNYWYALSVAKKEKVEIPLSLAYLSFVPQVVSLHPLRFSRSSQVIGEKYCSFVRKHNPGLARRLERRFLAEVKGVPADWACSDDGVYTPVISRKKKWYLFR